MMPTHNLKLADGYGTTPCELLAVNGPIATVRIRENAYWEREHFTTRVVRTAAISNRT